MGSIVNWSSILTYTEKVKVHLARAFVMNPELLVLQRPLHHFRDAAKQEIFTLIRQHVSNRGLSYPPGTVHNRRPRTCFMSTESRAQAMATDVYWEIDKGMLYE